MRLENLYTNFGLMSPEEQLEFVAGYRLRRAIDMDLPATRKVSRAKGSSPKKESPKLTEEEKKIAKMLGLKQKDLLALRALTETDEDIIEEGNVDLFAED